MVTLARNKPFFSLFENETTVYQVCEHGLFGRFYLWLNQKSSDNKTLNFLTKSLVITGIAMPPIVCAFLIPVGGLVSWLAGGFTIASTVTSVMQWQSFKKYERAAAFEKKTENLPPPHHEHPMFKTSRETFNQGFSFVVDPQNYIWVARRVSRDKPPVWKPLYIEHYDPTAVIDIDLKADGKNFMAMVTSQDQTDLFYKEIMLNKREDGHLKIQDITSLPSSESMWFSLPVVSFLFRSQWGQRLRSSDSKNRWFMSNAGAIREHVKDAIGQSHDIWNCTTVFIQEGNLIKICDPFVTQGSEMTFSLPPGVTIYDVQASASRVLLFGEKTRDGISQNCLYERTISYDDHGMNPMMKTSFNIQDKGKHILPMSLWKEHELPHDELLGRVNVIQTGQQEDAQISITGVKDGTYGFFYKKLEDQIWQFYENQPIQDFDEHHDFQINPRQPLLAKNVQFLFKPFKTIQCSHFDLKALDAQLKLETQDGQKVTLNLTRTGSLIKAVVKGHFEDEWVLSLAPENQTSAWIDWFGGKTNAYVTLQKQQDGIRINIKEQHIDIPFENMNQNPSLTFSQKDNFNALAEQDMAQYSNRASKRC